MPEQHIGLLITLSAYGNRLHGDLRGSVDRWHNTYGEDPLEPNSVRAGFEQATMRHEAVVFTEMQRSAIEAAVAEACEFADWLLGPINCRTNHLHAVVGTEDDRVRVMARLKTRSTLALRQQGLTAPGAPVWARGGSGRYLWTKRDIELAGQYVAEGQGAPLPGTQVWRDRS